MWLIRDLKRNLTVSQALSATDTLLGSAVTVSYDLEYQGRRHVPVVCIQAADRPVSVDGSPLAFELSPGSQTVAFTLRPTRRGSHAVRSLRLILGSALFRGTVTAGGEATINAYLVMGQDRAATGSRRGRVQRLQLPGSEALQKTKGATSPTCATSRRATAPGTSTWARSSRSPALVVRAFEDEHTLPLLILIDVDPSMDRGTAKTELESAVELATLLASQVLLDNERVGLACFSRCEASPATWPRPGGKDQMSHIRSALSALKAVEGDPAARSGFPTLQEAEAVRRMFGRSAAASAIAPVMEETIRQFSVNVREDGFVKAMARASQSTGTPCSIVVLTNLSMGVASLLSGSRIATYYGHNVAVAADPPHLVRQRGGRRPGEMLRPLPAGQGNDLAPAGPEDRRRGAQRLREAGDPALPGQDPWQRRDEAGEMNADG